MCVDLSTDITGPVAMITYVFKVTLVDEVIFHVSEHRDGTRSHATARETFRVELDVWMDGGELHDGGEVNGQDGWEESTIGWRREIGDVMPDEKYDVEWCPIRARVAMGTTVCRTTSYGCFGCVLKDVEEHRGLAGWENGTSDGRVKSVIVVEAEESMTSRDVVCVRVIFLDTIAGSG